LVCVCLGVRVCDCAAHVIGVKGFMCTYLLVGTCLLACGCGGNPRAWVQVDMAEKVDMATASWVDRFAVGMEQMRERCEHALAVLKQEIVREQRREIGVLCVHACEDCGAGGGFGGGGQCSGC
jgi:hypothetical protein